MPLFIAELPECKGCAACCSLLVEVYADEAKRIPFHMMENTDRVPSGIRMKRHDGTNDCVALDPVTRLCTIYDKRPKICRDFDRGNPACIAVVEDERREVLTLLTLKGEPCPK